MVVLPLVLTAALAGELRAFPVQGTGPDVVRTATPDLHVDWDGGPAALWVGEDDRWRRLVAERSPPVIVTDVPLGASLALERDGQRQPPTTPSWTWTPADVAAWSGEGLRGAVVTAMAPTQAGLWAATDGGGLALWDGGRWRHLDRRIRLGSDHVRDVVLGEDARWLVVGDEVVRLDADGDAWRTAAFGPDQQALAVAPMAVGAWVATTAGMVRLLPDERARRALEAPCTGFLDRQGPSPLAACAPPWRPPRSGLPTPDVAGLHPIAWVPTTQGPWAVTAHEGVWRREGDRWSQLIADWGVPLTSARPVGAHVALGTLGDGLQILGGDTRIGVRRADGLPDLRVRSLAAGPIDAKVWVGTERGVALVHERGAATPLPIAPLAAGVPTTHVVPSGAALGIATPDGLRWVGPKPPKGWPALQVAVPSPGGLVKVAQAWWAWQGQDVVVLERGQLTRFSAHAEVHAIHPSDDGVLVATNQGLRAWVHGATSLSPMRRLPGLRAFTGGHAAGWWADDHTLRATQDGTRAVPMRTVYALRAASGGVAVASTQGLHHLSSLGDLTVRWPGIDADGFVAVDVVDRVWWGADTTGQIWHDTPQGPVPTRLPGPIPVRVHQIVADDLGAWIATERGLYRVTGSR